jgi:hypothetical protein
MRSEVSLQMTHVTDSLTHASRMRRVIKPLQITVLSVFWGIPDVPRPQHGNSIMCRVLHCLSSSQWLHFNLIQNVPLETQPTTITYHSTKIRLQVGPPYVADSPNHPRDTRIKVTLVARPLLTPVAQNLCRCEHGVFTSR